MQKLNGKLVLLNGTGIFMSGEYFEIVDRFYLKFQETSSGEMGISLTAEGAGFTVNINNFAPGVSMTSVATGTLGGRNILLRISANRLSEVGGKGFYEIKYMLSDA